MPNTANRVATRQGSLAVVSGDRFTQCLQTGMPPKLLFRPNIGSWRVNVRGPHNFSPMFLLGHFVAGLKISGSQFPI